MAAGESIQAEAERRGVSYFTVRNERAQNRGFTGYAAERAASAEARRKQLDMRREPYGLQRPFGPSPDPAWSYYWPTKTRRPSRQYSQFARYSAIYQQMEIVFRDGTPWTWNQFTPEMWDQFKTENSTYDVIKPRGGPGALPQVTSLAMPGSGERGGWGSIVGEGGPARTWAVGGETFT